MPTDEENRKQATENILNSSCCKKLIVAGPGAGKTYIFSQLLKKMSSDRSSHLVLTFINTLKDDLDSSLSSLAKVYTLHGYCNYLLHNRPFFRGSLTENFTYYPALWDLISSDWTIIENKQQPEFIKLMRELNIGQEISFYLSRGDFYDSITFDDSVYRVNQALESNPEYAEKFALILIDEFQDFNALEASFIEKLATNPIVVAGDDDQALYGNLRNASRDFIRTLHREKEYDNFELPYCMRCTEIIIKAFNDIVIKAQSLGYLKDRISKQYLFYPPLKLSDSQLYPKISAIECSVQLKSLNYFGKYINEYIKNIPEIEVEESNKNGFPTVLIIGPKHYLRQVEEVVSNDSYNITKKEKEDIVVSRTDGLNILKNNQESNLGWRIIIESDNPSWKNEVINNSYNSGNNLFSLIPSEYKQGVILEALETSIKEEEKISQNIDMAKPTIQFVSFEGSKGLSAQHVFILGLQESELPRNSCSITDIEICKFLVALTRARKKTNILTTSRFSGKKTRASIFISWIDQTLKDVIKIDKTYWR